MRISEEASPLRANYEFLYLLFFFSVFRNDAKLFLPKISFSKDCGLRSVFLFVGGSFDRLNSYMAFTDNN